MYLSLRNSVTHLLSHGNNQFFFNFAQKKNNILYTENICFSLAHLNNGFFSMSSSYIEDDCFFSSIFHSVYFKYYPNFSVCLFHYLSITS